LKHAETASFWADWDRLSRREQEPFIAALRRLSDAFARRRSRRVPEGRATFELADSGGELGIKCWRVGTHAIYADP